MNRDINTGSRHIALMRNREFFNKIILLSLVGVLTIGNLMIIFYRIMY